MAWTNPNRNRFPADAPPVFETAERYGGLEDDGSLNAWLRRHRNPHQFSKGVRVRTSPKRLEDPIQHGTTTDDPHNDGGEWKVNVNWDNPRRTGHSIDLRSLVPLETY